jgi:hypothetical protein
MLFARSPHDATAIGTVTDVRITDNNDHVAYPGSGPASDDGRFRATACHLRVEAPAGCYLANPTLVCTGGAGCAFTNTHGGAQIQGDGSAVTALTTAWSLPVTWTLRAEVFRREPIASDTPRP